ncbi:electron transport complex subunit RsxE [Agathobacter ruminis]|uniref:electron transport complex subunit RsxE n=1 Tax=Agathobacter ruminis TaxID=1712665 RepID=UPI001FA89B7B|nr:electron transport complex subunit E [Agathobacter ruminis]MDC7300819.1 electron transport complex subunit E [Agathobacter ruminis]
MNKYLERLYNGIIKENPTFVLMLGMCPTLAVTSSAINGLGMGLSTTVVLVLSNLLISLFRKVIPNGVRMPAFIVVVASLVTIVQFMLQAYLPSLSNALGVYIPLIVVNCIILGRAESYASKNPPVESIFDGLGMGLGFTFGLTCIGLIREILGAATAFSVNLASLSTAISVCMLVAGLICIVLIGYLIMKHVSPGKIFLETLAIILALAGLIAVLGGYYKPITIFIMAPGAFLVLAVLVVVMNLVREHMKEQGEPLAEPAGCFAGSCANCAQAKACASAKAANQTEEVEKA